MENIVTLQDFMLQTKTILYLLGAGYLIGFIWFWKILISDEKENK